MTTLPLPATTLDAFRAISPKLRVEQWICSDPAEIPPEVWREVEVLHTGSVIPSRPSVPSLRLLQLDTSGIDHITDTDLWMDSDIPVATIRGISARWMAEYVLMMILGLSHNLPGMLQLKTTHTWPTLEQRWHDFGPAPLVGARAVVVGFGAIGRAIGALCCALGMEVVGVRRGAGSMCEAAEGHSSDFMFDSAVFPLGLIEEVPSARLPEVVVGARFVIVVVPLTEATRGLIDRSVINAMSEDTVLINVARGGIVDENAVADALRNSRLGAAVFDVFEDEPLPAASPLWDTPHLLISPHVSGLAGDYLPQMERLVAENLRRLLDGAPLVNLADRVAGY